MSTVIYPAPIFGPIHSRRLGVSLGINLMPADGKVCTFDCLYCECGLNAERRPRLRAMKADGPKPDVLTFAGNGEPTAHPDFAGIVDDVAELRDEYFPQAKISVLSNATMITRPAVRDALMKVDNNILKLDTANPAYIERMNRPTGVYDVRRIIENMKLFNGHVIVQTMFLHGTDGEESLTNTGDGELIVRAVETGGNVAPTITQGQGIAGGSSITAKAIRDQKLRKATHEELDDIVKRINEAGFPATASY